MTLDHPKYETETKPLQPENKGYKTQGKIDQQTEKVKELNDNLSRLREEYEAEASKTQE